MAFQRVPNTAEISVIYELCGFQLQNTYHAYSVTGYVQADLDFLAAQIDTVPVTGMLADQSDHLDYIRTDVQGLDAENDLKSSNNNHAGPGSVNVWAMPNQVSFCVAKLSGYSGRTARGRVYVIGIPSSYTLHTDGTTNLITSAARAAYEGHVDAFRTTIESIGIWDAVIVSRYHNGSKRAEATTIKWTTTTSNSNKLATMRRRTV